MSRVILVSECGKECPILASILAAVSPTCWGERFGLAPPDGDVRSWENGMSLFEVESFIGVATLLSPYPTMPELMMKPNRSSITAHLDVQRLTAALSLCHKYDCGGLVKLIAYLADFHFPSALLPERTSNSGIDDNAMRESRGHGSTLHSRVRAAESSRSDVAQQSAVPVAQWITQSHINFIVRAQELLITGLDYTTTPALLSLLMRLPMEWHGPHAPDLQTASTSCTAGLRSSSRQLRKPASSVPRTCHRDPRHIRRLPLDDKTT